MDIDERDGYGDSVDDDILTISHTFFTDQDKTSYTFGEPVIHAGWAGAGDQSDWFRIGMIYYRDCTDGIWPDMHGSEY